MSLRNRKPRARSLGFPHTAAEQLLVGGAGRFNREPTTRSAWSQRRLAHESRSAGMGNRARWARGSWRRVISPTHPDASRRRDPDRYPCSVAATRVLTPAVGGSLEATTLLQVGAGNCLPRPRPLLRCGCRHPTASLRDGCCLR
jgi:hypothetical protein